ncbi:MAG: hypothetical protein JRI73_12355 [Deltaproteobacteria bacterium]|nr:hypothetical protein [Deltaproteobacteria bacterium]
MENQMTIEKLTKFFGICFLLTAGLLVLWFVVFLVWGDFAFNVHLKLFNIQRPGWEGWEMMNFCGMGFIKILAWVFFLIPYIALKIVGRRKNGPT